MYCKSSMVTVDAVSGHRTYISIDVHNNLCGLRLIKCSNMYLFSLALLLLLEWQCSLAALESVALSNEGEQASLFSSGKAINSDLLCFIAVISMSKDAYIVTKNVIVTEQNTRIVLSFKTIDSTGVLVHLRSSSRQDYLTLELVRGRLRYSANFGDAMLNQREPPSGFHQLIVAKDLADNKWHTIELVKKINAIFVYLDRNEENLNSILSYMKTPPGAKSELSYDRIYLGGMRSFFGVTERQSISQDNIALCIDEAQLNDISLLSGETSGTILNYCPTISYSPIVFPTSLSHLRLPSYKESSIDISFKFRTVVNKQSIFNFTTDKTGRNVRFGFTPKPVLRNLELRITQYGKVSLQFIIGPEHELLETWKGGFNDGGWHQVAFTVSDEEQCVVTLSVDNLVKKISLRAKSELRGWINFGFGFTGCLRDLFLNKKVVDAKKLRSSGKVRFSDCQIRDFCNPNPCLNGGSCSQNEATFFCNCQETDFFGTACDKPRTNRTCGEIFERGERRRGVYGIDLDGIGPMPTVQAFCIMGATAEDAITQINSTIGRSGIPVISNTSNFKAIDITYRADEKSIRELILNSRSCQQFLKYDCNRSRIFNTPYSVPLDSIFNDTRTRWFGEDNKVHYYWAGTKGKENHCACGITNTCVDRGRLCNCDARLSTPQFDQGFLSVKEDLPVRRVEFYDVANIAGSAGHMKLGPLQCKGLGGRDVMVTFRERFSFVEVEPIDKDGLVDAGMISIEFKTRLSNGVLVYSRGPITRDYVKMEIVSPSRMRLSINIGADREYRDVILEVDVSSLNVVLDDNNWHNATVSFNRKEVTFGIHNLTKTRTFWYKDGVTHLNVDGTPLYVGANPYDLAHGFVGCMRNVFIMGRLADLPDSSNYVEETGVYTGCGSACTLIDNPCNHGDCIERYSSYSCDCSVSPMQGNHCHTEPYSLSFNDGGRVTYNLTANEISSPTYLVISFGFKTKQKNNVFFQLVGSSDRYIVCLMQNGSIRVIYDFRGSSGINSASFVQLAPSKDQIFHDDIRHTIRLTLENGKIALQIKDMSTIAPVVERISGKRKILTGFKTINVGASIVNSSSLPSSLPKNFIGCSTGMKVVFSPNENNTETLINVYEKVANKSIGITTASITNTACGTPLYQAGTLEKLIPPASFQSVFFEQSKFGNKTEFDDDKPIIFAIIGTTAIMLIIILLIIAIFVSSNVEN